ncbi:MAG: hypothetical protein ACRDOV_11075, partial [Streptomyces sp.]
GVDSDSDVGGGTFGESDGESEHADTGTPDRRLTDIGLPKRTPQQVAAQSGPVEPRKRGANAEEMRRRLGGFQQGAQHGRRDAAAELDAEDSETDQAGAQSDGGNAEEART